MSGHDAIKGFMAQTTIAVMRTLQLNKPWQSLTLEPREVDDEYKKIDLVWKLNSIERRVQVKSSDRKIGYGEAERWADSMIQNNTADSTELILSLVGIQRDPRLYSGRQLLDKVTVDILPVSPSDEIIIALLAQELHSYLSNLDILIKAQAQESICRILRDRLTDASIRNWTIERREFDEYLMGLVRDYTQQDRFVSVIGSKRDAREHLYQAVNFVGEQLDGVRADDTFRIASQKLNDQETQIRRAYRVILILSHTYDENTEKLSRLANELGKEFVVLDKKLEGKYALMKTDIPTPFDVGTPIAEKKQRNFDNLQSFKSWVAGTIGVDGAFEHDDDLAVLLADIWKHV